MFNLLITVFQAFISFQIKKKILLTPKLESLEESEICLNLVKQSILQISVLIQ